MSLVTFENTDKVFIELSLNVACELSANARLSSVRSSLWFSYGVYTPPYSPLLARLAAARFSANRSVRDDRCWRKAMRFGHSNVARRSEYLNLFAFETCISGCRCDLRIQRQAPDCSGSLDPVVINVSQWATRASLDHFAPCPTRVHGEWRLYIVGRPSRWVQTAVAEDQGSVS